MRERGCHEVPDVVQQHRPVPVVVLVHARHAETLDGEGRMRGDLTYE